MEKKYSLEAKIKTPTGKTVYRIKALKDFVLFDGKKISKGDLGGVVSSEENLSQDGRCWVCFGAMAADKSKVLEDAVLYDNTVIRDNAVIKGKATLHYYASMLDNAVVCDKAVIRNRATISENAFVDGDVIIRGNATVFGQANIRGDAVIQDNARIYGDAVIQGNARIYGKALVASRAVVTEEAAIGDNSKVFGKISGHALIGGNVVIEEGSIVSGNSNLLGNVRVSGKSVINDVVVMNYSPFTSSNDYVLNIPSIEIGKGSSLTVIPIRLPSGLHSLTEFVSDGKIEAVLLSSPLLRPRKTFRKYNSYAEMLRGMKKVLNLSKKKNSAEVGKEINFLFDYLENCDFTSVGKTIEQMGDEFFSRVLNSCFFVDRALVSAKRKQISELASKYIFAQFIGIFLFGIEMFASIVAPDVFWDLANSEYRDFLLDIINKSDIDIPLRALYIDAISFAWSEEMIYAIKKTFNLNEFWKDNSVVKMRNIANSENALTLFPTSKSLF